MSRTAWAAIITAIAMPSVALVVVSFLNARRPEPAWAPGHMGPGPGCDGMREPPFDRGKEFPDEMLVRLRGPLGLSDEQVERIRGIVDPARKREAELDVLLREDRTHLGTLLQSGDPDEKKVEEAIGLISGHQEEIMRLHVLTPLRVDKVLTGDQRAMLEKMWKGGNPPPPPPPGMWPPPDLPAGIQENAPPR